MSALRLQCGERRLRAGLSGTINLRSHRRGDPSSARRTASAYDLIMLGITELQNRYVRTVIKNAAQVADNMNKTSRRFSLLALLISIAALGVSWNSNRSTTYWMKNQLSILQQAIKNQEQIRTSLIQQNQIQSNILSQLEKLNSSNQRRETADQPRKR